MYTTGVPGGSGGGCIRIQAEHLRVDGVTAADGASASAGGATGSGGSIYIITGFLEGSGVIRANGNGLGFTCGGGGRVAVYYGHMTNFSGVIQAMGGLRLGYTDANGGAGTVYLKQDSDAYGELIVDNGGNDTLGWSTPLPDLGILRLMSFIVSGHARFSTPSSLRVASGSPGQFNSLISTNYLQVGSLLVSNTWVFGDVIEPVMSRSNGVPVVTVYCRPQMTYLLLATTNFLDWSPVATFTPTGSSFAFADTDAPRVGRRFFRAVMHDYLYDAIGLSFNRTNRQAELSLNGAQPNHTLVLQASGDLRSWTPIATVIPSAVTNWQFLDTNAPSLQKRFYRAVGQGR